MTEYDVVLTFGRESPHAQLFEGFADLIVSHEGPTLFRLSCSQVEDANYYLAVVLSDQSKIPQFRCRIPQHLVLLIVDGRLPKNPVGFSPPEPQAVVQST